MRKFQILEHRADLKIRIFGKTKEELFLNAVLAMASGLRPKIKNQKSPKESLRFPTGPAKIKKIKVSSSNLETLLVDFLSEVLYLTQVNKEIYTDVKFKKFSDKEISAEIMGRKVERFGEDIKAVTYHNLDVHQKEDGSWEGTILFDI